MRPSLRTVVGAAALLAGLLLIEMVVQQSLVRTLHVQLGAVLDATRSASVEDVRTWVDIGLHAVETAARDRALLTAADRCSVAQAAAHTVMTERECGDVSRALEPYFAALSLHHARLVDRSGVLIAKLEIGASELDAEAAGKLAQLADQRAAVLDTSIAQHQSALVVGILIREQIVLVAELPLTRLAAQMLATRVGRSGETYVFDERGRMLTQSRFRSNTEPLELRIPSTGGLTRPVQALRAGQSGHDLEGYPDYRGELVVGSYGLLAEHGLGVVTELDVTDAYRTLASVKRAFVVLAGLLLFVLAGALVLLARSARLRTRAEVAEARALRFGQYRIEEKLGEGGMGAVYLASHALLRRKAAIKLLRADRTTPDALGRFEREVQVTATLTHPNTVAIYDYGRTDDGTFYYVMELLEGLDLHRLVKLTGPLSQARVLALLRQACGSLAEAHAAGIVHRDVKPANLFVCTRGGVADTLKVLDFGIVALRALDQNDEQLVLGTPEYMAPELFESGTQASPQSDLYALGVVAYYLLTGAPPFGGGATLELGHAHLTMQPPKLSEAMSEELDPDLELAILACLRKHPSARPSSATAMISLLNRSRIAMSWTPSEAAAWWLEHTPVLSHARQSTEPEASKRSIMVSTR